MATRGAGGRARPMEGSHLHS